MTIRQTPRYFTTSQFNYARYDKDEEDDGDYDKEVDENDREMKRDHVNYDLSSRETRIFENFSPEKLSIEEKAAYDLMSPEERAELEVEWDAAVKELNDPDGGMSKEIDNSMLELERDERDNPEPPDVEEKVQLGFWGEDEEDELAQVEDGDEGSDNVITSMAEAELELHREMRHYARIAAWDMPLLASMFIWICIFIFRFRSLHPS
jgi:hypothetical protein